MAETVSDSMAHSPPASCAQAKGKSEQQKKRKEKMSSRASATRAKGVRESKVLCKWSTDRAASQNSKVTILTPAGSPADTHREDNKEIIERNERQR